MATIALPLRRGSLARVGTGVPLVVGMVGTLASWLGSGWDVSWHRIFGRDTFWTTPHLFIYVGVSLWGIAALFATVTAMAGRPIRGRALVVGPLRAELGIALIGIGALITILAAPFDNAWHAAFGRDVDIWSPPHIFGIAGGGIGLVGWIAALAPGVFSLGEPLRRLLRLFMLGNLCAVCVFGMNFYYIFASTREAFFYPLLIAALLPAVLAIGTLAVPGRWAATATAASYTAIGLAGYGILAGSGWRPPAFPALVIVGAVALANAAIFLLSDTPISARDIARQDHGIDEKLAYLSTFRPQVTQVVSGFDSVLVQNYLGGRLPALEYDPANADFTIPLSCDHAPPHMPCAGTTVDVVLWDDLLRAEGGGWQEVRMAHGGRLRIQNAARTASLRVSQGLGVEIVH